MIHLDAGSHVPTAAAKEDTANCTQEGRGSLCTHFCSQSKSCVMPNFNMGSKMQSYCVSGKERNDLHDVHTLLLFPQFFFPYICENILFYRKLPPRDEEWMIRWAALCTSWLWNYLIPWFLEGERSCCFCLFILGTGINPRAFPLSYILQPLFIFFETMSC